jgi:hypothetical protein
MTVIYRIKSIDQENHVLDVEFNGGPIRKYVPLKPPYPATKEEVDAAIQPYVPTDAELQAATSQPAPDYNLLTSLLDTAQSIAAPAPAPADPAVQVVGINAVV